MAPLDSKQSLRRARRSRSASSDIESAPNSEVNHQSQQQKIGRRNTSNLTSSPSKRKRLSCVGKGGLVRRIMGSLTSRSFDPDTNSSEDEYFSVTSKFTRSTGVSAVGLCASRNESENFEGLILSLQSSKIIAEFDLDEQQRIQLHGPTDLTLQVEDADFRVHRDVLVKNSDYFASMFGFFGESGKDSVRLHRDPVIPGIIDPSKVASVLQYLYTEKISISPKNAQDYLHLSNYLQISRLTETCVQYIRDRLDRKNCFSIYVYASLTGPYKLQKYAEEFILSNFQEIVSGKSFEKEISALSTNQFTALISNDNLNVTSEGVVYKAIIGWVNQSPRDRATHLPSLLNYVHFPLMSTSEVESYRRDSRVKKTRNLALKFQEVEQYFKKVPKEKVIYWLDKKKPVRWPKIFVVMRMYWKNLPMEYYDFKTKQWNTLCTVQNWRSCSSMVAYQSLIYLIGGEEVDEDSPTGSRTVNRVTRYNSEFKKWSSAPSMTLARRWSASVVVDDTLYVIGGIGGKGGTYEKRLDSMESLDLSNPKAKWKTLASMSTARSSHTVEVLHGKIYVVGGGDGTEWLCSSEVYDIKTNKWSPISKLRTKRWKCGLGVVRGHIYAIGGMDSPSAGFWGSPLHSVEKYDPETDRWTELSPMNEARFGAAVVAYQGKIYVSGGFGAGKSILNSTEVYDPVSDKWTKVAGMKKMCGFVGGALVDRPICLDEEENE